MNPLFTPEHLHVALNHIPLIGLTIALLPLAYGLILSQRHVLIVGLLIALLSSLSIPFIMGSGEDTFERFSEGPHTPLLDPVGRHYMGVHGHNAETGSKIIYAVIVSSLLGLIAIWKFPRWQKALAALTFLLCFLGALAAIWIASTGGMIRHPEFRPPAAQAHE